MTAATAALTMTAAAKAPHNSSCSTGEDCSIIQKLSTVYQTYMLGRDTQDQKQKIAIYVTIKK